MTTTRWRSIVAVVTDPFAKRQPAAKKAAALAKRCGAKLTLVNVFMIPQPISNVAMDDRDAIIRAAKRERRERMAAFSASWRRQGIRVSTIVEWDFPPHEAIVRVVLKEKPDLLVAHSHRHGKLARWVLANTDWELMRHCPCPMWFIRDEALPARPNVLVAVDPRHTHAKPARLDDRLLSTAADLTDQLGGSIEIVHAYEETNAEAARASIERLGSASKPDESDALKSLSKDIERLARRHDIDSRACHLIGGSATTVLPALAKKIKADVLVMGAVSRSRLSRPVIGSTAEKVIDDVDCDVLVVKPAGYKSDVPRVRPK